MDILLRAKDRATFLSAAEAEGFLKNGVPIPGVSIDEIGPHTRGGTIDPRHHVNIRIALPDLGKAFVDKWKTLGLPGTNNAGEVSWKLFDLELVEGVAHQSRVWL